MNELEIAKNALEQIVGYYRRSHKHGENTCHMMCLEAERALQEMSLLTQHAADGAICPRCEHPLNINWHYCAECGEVAPRR